MTTHTTDTASPSLAAKHLVIGLDGAGLDLVRGFGPALLPNMHALMARGAYAAMHVLQPPATLPNWTSLLTGENPGVHGVFDFTTRSGYDVRFTAGSIREAKTLAARLDARGLRCACLFFPGTFPPEVLQHGVFISGWDAPVAFEADHSFVSPASLHQEIVQRFGVQRFDDVDEFDADAPGWHARLPEALCKRIERRTELAGWLLDRKGWDLFAVYFGESDTASHHLWALHDPNSPRRPFGPSAQPTAELTSGLARVYAALDRAVGTLLERAGGLGVEVTLVSDHGSGGASDKVLYLNRALSQAGFLRFNTKHKTSAWVAAAKEFALTRLPAKLREQVFRSFGTSLPSWLESRARFGAIDMPGTRAFSEELNYFPGIHWNLIGRDPQGTLAVRDVPRARAELEAALLALRDPWTGLPVVAKVHAREDLFSGPHVARAPDLLLELALDRGYSYNVMPSAQALTNSVFRRLSPDEYLGRKGRSLQGSHRDQGLFVAAGPQVAQLGEIAAHVLDVAPTLLARMHVPAPASWTGRVLTRAPDTSLTHELELRRQSLPEAQLESVRAQTLPKQSSAQLPDAAGDARVANRLRRLGYIE